MLKIPIQLRGIVMVYNINYIVALNIEGGHICTDCATEQEWLGISSEEVIHGDIDEDIIYFCDDCKKILNAPL